jgi:hypothetical protein
MPGRGSSPILNSLMRSFAGLTTPHSRSSSQANPEGRKLNANTFRRGGQDDNPTNCCRDDKAVASSLTNGSHCGILALNTAAGGDHLVLDTWIPDAVRSGLGNPWVCFAGWRSGGEIAHRNGD